MFWLVVIVKLTYDSIAWSGLFYQCRRLAVTGRIYSPKWLQSFCSTRFAGIFRLTADQKLFREVTANQSSITLSFASSITRM